MRLPIKTIVSLVLLAGTNSFAQPVLNGQLPDIGFSAPMYLGTNITSAGTGGAGVEWDFGFQSTFNFLGYLEYTEVANTEFADDFITCNLVARKRISGDTTYTYYTDFGNYVEIYGENMGAPAANKYTTDKKMLWDFPMNYGDSLVDTWQSLTTSGTIRRYYDGYGTLITNFYEFHNVARIKNVDSFLVGANMVGRTSYTWYTTDALLPVAHFEDNGQQMTILKMFPVSVGNTSRENNIVRWAPNPFSERTTLLMDNVVPGTKLILTNALGQVVMQQEVNSNSTTINRNGLNSGIYFYKVHSNEGIAAKGKLVIE